MLAFIVRVDKRTKHWFVSQPGRGWIPKTFVHSAKL